MTIDQELECSSHLQHNAMHGWTSLVCFFVASTVVLHCDPSALVLGSLGFGPGELGLPWVGFPSLSRVCWTDAPGFPVPGFVGKGNELEVMTGAGWVHSRGCYVMIWFRELI